MATQETWVCVEVVLVFFLTSLCLPHLLLLVTQSRSWTIFESVLPYYLIIIKLQRHRSEMVNVNDQNWATLLSLKTIMILTHAHLVFMYHQDQ